MPNIEKLSDDVLQEMNNWLPTPKQTVIYWLSIGTDEEKQAITDSYPELVKEVQEN